jgi:NSS family neurotransmitter:Na+ symporter
MPLGLSNGIMPGLVIGERTLFDWIDFITANILLPLMGLLITIFAGFRWKAAAESTGLSQGWLRLWLLALRYIAPILMLLVLLYTSGVLAF